MNQYYEKMSVEQSLFEEIVLSFGNAELGSMFGKACGKINKKAFLAFYQNEMVFKLGKDAVDTFKQRYEGAQNWDPSGKNLPMKDWVQVPADYKGDWPSLAKQALEFLE